MSRASYSKVVHNFHTELAAHVLPDGWDSNVDRFTFMYKNKAKPGKQFMLTVIEPKFDMSIRFFCVLTEEMMSRLIELSFHKDNESFLI